MFVNMEFNSVVFTLLVMVQLMTMSVSKRHRKRQLSCEHSQQDTSFLWTLSDRVPPVYFFGTIHVPYTMVWDHIPYPAKKSFERADSVFFELDLSDPETVAQLASCQMLPSGKTLSDILPDELYRRLKSHLDYVKLMIPNWMEDEHRGLFAEYLFKAMAGNWEKKRPVWVMLMLNSLTENDVRSRGIPVLDLHLAREAARLGKRAGAVERAEEQCLPLNGLDVTQVIFALNQTLMRLEKLRNGRPSSFYDTDELVRNYNCRNLTSDAFKSNDLLSDNDSTADELLLSRDINRYFRRELIEKRNARMADRVLQLIKQHPDESFFFAFGTGHFLGNGSVLDYLQDGGYQVEQVAPYAKIKNFRRPHHHSRQRGPHNQQSPTNLNPWDENSRRRYKKRGHHHHGVQLLRSITTTPTTKVKVHQQRQFNDLWVKLDSPDRFSEQSSHDTKESAGKNYQKKSQPWHPKGDSKSASQIFILEKLIWITWLACVQYHRQLLTI